MLSAVSMGIGVLIILVGLLGHHHAERGARSAGRSGPALSRAGALAMGVLFLLFGLIVFATGY